MIFKPPIVSVNSSRNLFFVAFIPFVTFLTLFDKVSYVLFALILNCVMTIKRFQIL